MLSLTQQLIHSTARIESIKTNGKNSSGTGFFFGFCRQGDNYIPALVTNRHVVQDTKKSWFHVTMATEDNNPDYGNHQRIEIEYARWMFHPEPKVDLAVCLVGDMAQTLKTPGKKVFFRNLDVSYLPDKAMVETLTAMEDVVIIGYPNGIWDPVNNLPILRRGVTATPAFLDYEGRKEFLVDCAIYPGSSGSPVFLLNQGSYPDNKGNLNIGNRIALLGIVSGVFIHSAEGKIELRTVPTAVAAVPISLTPNNIGQCIKSERLLDFEVYLQKIAVAKDRLSK